LAGLEVTGERGTLWLTVWGSQLGSPELAALDAAPEAGWVTGLVVREVTPRAAGVLAEQPWLARITDLRLLSRAGHSWWGRDYCLGDDGAAALAGSPHLGRLSSLGAPSAGLSSAGLVRLAACPALSGPAVLDLQGNRVGGDGVRALAGRSRLAGLRRLVLDGTGADDDGVEALAEALDGCPLERLHLAENPLGPRAAAALGRARLPRLDALDLRRTGVGGKGVRALAASRALEGVRTLELGYCGAGDRGALALAAAGHLRRLRVLGLEGNGIYPDGAFALADARHLRRLRELRLQGNLVGSQAAQALRMIFDDRVTF
jgi:hypothetical protein